MGLADSFEYILGITVGIIGIFTFILSLINRARQDGAMMNKIDTMMRDISDIKTDVKNYDSTQKSQSLDLMKHEERIDTLFSNVSRIDKRIVDLEHKIERECNDG